ncbi:hypothetical protein C8J56DRAFT_1007498 [Mycena floridula]|nr:hypothetical protein C8J56DRAFT_1007498 [Mycena floridula]
MEEVRDQDYQGPAYYANDDIEYFDGLDSGPTIPPIPSEPASADDNGFNPYIHDYPTPAGTPIYNASKLPTQFEQIRNEQIAKGLDPWAPFDSQDDWELARFIMKSGLSQAKIDEFLKLKLISEGAKPSYHNKRAFLQKIDSLNLGPGWKCEMFDTDGENRRLDDEGIPMTEEIEFWCRDPAECVKELLGNPAFKDHMRYAPEQQYMDEKCTNRAYSESWTGEWWWDGRLPIGSTIAPIILSSDKTQLSRFSGDKQAWPVYLSIGNISKEKRRKPSERAMVLIGYLPVTKLECYDKDVRSLEQQRLFHKCMKSLLEPIVEARKNGVPMMCSDGFVRHVYPIVMAYIADHPEQCLIAGCTQNSCPRCIVPPDQSGEGHKRYDLRTHETTLEILVEAAEGGASPEIKSYGLNLISPFWQDLPHCDIFSCITPDLLHQLHKGVFKDHLSKWVTETVDKETAPKRAAEIDARFMCIPDHPSLRHFSKEISVVSQWTGHEYKNMEKIFLGVATGAVVDPKIVTAVHAILDFIFYAHFEFHTDKSLVALQNSWATFHNNKDVFVDLEVRKHFNIPKFHSMCHYPSSIRSRGTNDGFNTEGTERLHIDLCKVGYSKSNRKGYTQQMTTWLTRQEAVDKFSRYLQWAVIDYSIPAERQVDLDPDEEESEAQNAVDDEGDAEEEAGYIHVPHQQTVLPHYEVAKHLPSDLRRVSLDKLETSYGAYGFIDCLERFLKSRSMCPRDFNKRSEDAVYSLYRRVTINLPPAIQCSSYWTRDPVRATPLRPKRGLKKEAPAHFDTVLARKEAPQDISQRDTFNPSEHFVARVRVIFKLPAVYGSFDEPLAFVEWFTPLRVIHQSTSMYQIKPATLAGQLRRSIIPVSLILRSCHLVPVFGSRVDRTWTKQNILDVCPSFLLNSYLRHLDFIMLAGKEL